MHDFDEPFKRLLTQGMINKETKYCPQCKVFAMKHELKNDKCSKCSTPYIMKSVKMSKSYGNTINPAKIINVYGADAARFFILFGASPSSSLEWSDKGVGFASKFLRNIFILLIEPPENINEGISIRDTLVKYYLNKTIKEVTENLEKIALRNAVNLIIQFTSELSKYKLEGVNQEVFDNCRENLTLLLHPIAPHITEEIWKLMGKEKYLSIALWPTYDESLLTIENEYKWKFIEKTIDSINHIKLIVKKEKLIKISIIIADEWKYKFYSIIMDSLDKTMNQGEIMKKLMQEKDLKPHSKIISQTLVKILKNIGKFSKFALLQREEHSFFKDIQSIFQKKYDCAVEILYEKDSKEKKAVQALPGRPAIIIS